MPQQRSSPVKYRALNLSISPVHGFSKQAVEKINCLAGEGIEGDAHCGVTVQHRSRVAADPHQPNLRQIHLLQSELLQELSAKGFEVLHGSLGENITTAGIDLLGLPRDAVLQFDGGVRLKITGLRNPCSQIEAFQTNLLKEVVGKDSQGNLVRRAGVMGVVETGGTITRGEAFQAILPCEPHHRLERV